MNFFDFFNGEFLLNAMGGTIRYVYGTVWRTIFNKPKFTYKEYIYGPKKPNYYDKMGHEFNNKMIGIIFFLIIAFKITNVI